MKPDTQLVIFLLAASLFFPNTVHAHPHAFTDAEISFETSGNTLTGIQQIWNFDDMFSLLMLEEFDTDRDGTFSTTELKTIEKESFGSLYEYNYFTHIKINGLEVRPPKGQKFKVKMNGSQMVYSFFIPLHVTPPAKIEVSIFDESYYTDVAFTVTKHNGQDISNEEASELTYYGGMITPRKAVLHLN